MDTFILCQDCIRKEFAYDRHAKLKSKRLTKLLHQRLRIETIWYCEHRQRMVENQEEDE